MPDLSPLEWIGVAAASWTVLSIAGASGLSFAASRLKRRRARVCATPPSEVVNRIDVLPPVPLPESWTDADEAMFAWFCAGRTER